jgi:urease accessory protein
MSLTLSFDRNALSADKITLPSRFYRFDECGENYVKILTIGDGLFPKDKVNISLKLKDSNLVLANESASKVHKSEGDFAVCRYNFVILSGSNLEFINDEVIPFGGSKTLQFFRVSLAQNSGFFYCDILSKGRSFERYNFSSIAVKNLFTIDGKVEYMERYEISGSWLLDYLNRRGKRDALFAKIYAKTIDNDRFALKLVEAGIAACEYTQNKRLLIALIAEEKISAIKKKIDIAWRLYREILGKGDFDLGKR